MLVSTDIEFNNIYVNTFINFGEGHIGGQKCQEPFPP